MLKECIEKVIRIKHNRVRQSTRHTCSHCRIEKRARLQLVNKLRRYLESFKIAKLIPDLTRK